MSTTLAPLFVMLQLPLFLMQRLDPEEMGRAEAAAPLSDAIAGARRRWGGAEEVVGSGGICWIRPSSS